jgi:FlaA1/EpsC-like NDP-sugar epimerase
VAQGGEVFLRGTGNPLKIIELARRMIELSGLSVRDYDNPGGDIAIEVLGLRPVEKPQKELLIGNNPKPISHSRIMKAHDGYPSLSALNAAIDALKKVLVSSDAV